MLHAASQQLKFPSAYHRTQKRGLTINKFRNLNATLNHNSNQSELPVFRNPWTTYSNCFIYNTSIGAFMRFVAPLLMAALLSFGFFGSARAEQLVMVEQDGCHWCARWNEELSHIYPKTEEGLRAPLRRVNLRDLPEDITFTSRPVFTPTFVLVRDGKELGRIEGYAGDEFFWFLLGQLLDAQSPADEVTQ
ncbi:MAG: hypothetical protein WBV78_05640 [Roseobacter sp.]